MHMTFLRNKVFSNLYLILIALSILELTVATYFVVGLFFILFVWKTRLFDIECRDLIIRPSTLARSNFEDWLSSKSTISSWSLVKTGKYEVIGLTPDIIASKRWVKIINWLPAVMKKVGRVEPVTHPKPTLLSACASSPMDECVVLRML